MSFSLVLSGFSFFSQTTLSGTMLFSLAGLSAPLLGGLLLGAGLLTVGLYLLKLRRRQVVVPFLELWERLLLERKASAWRSQLQRLLSFLLALLLVFALIFALADPRPEGEKMGRSVVILLDVSASMGSPAEDVGAKDALDVTRLQVAKRQIQSWFESFRGGDQVLLVEMGARPRPLEAFTGEMSQLESALEKAHVLDVSADFEAALLMARDALRGRERGEIIVVSDGALPVVKAFDQGPSVSFSYVKPRETSGEQGNLGITAFSARRYPLAGDRFEVLAEVANFGANKARAELSIYAAEADGARGQLVEVTLLELGPQQRFSRSFENLAHAEEGLIAVIERIDGVSDQFAGDNEARTLLSPRVPVRVLVVGESNNFLEAALLVEESFRVQRVSASAYPPAGEFDITIFDGEFRARVARTGAAIYLGVPGDVQSPYPVLRASRLESFGFDTWKKDSNVFRLIDPYDVQVLEGASLTPEQGDVVLGASAGRAIMIGGTRPEGQFLALGFSPRKSDLVLRAVWPLFVVNMIDELFPRGRGETLLGLQTGQTWRPAVASDDGESSALVRGPLRSDRKARERVVPLDRGRAVLFGQEAGFYEVVTKQGTTRFSASLFEADEAKKPSNPEPQLGEKKIGAVSGMDPRPHQDPWFWILFGVLSVSFVEWWLYHRRWTV